FSYERYLDYFRAQHFLNSSSDNTNFENVFKKDGAFWNELDTQLQLDSGFIEALSVLVPELYGKELYGLVELDDSTGEKHALEFLLKDNFQKSLYWRDPSKTNEDTLNQLNEVLGGLNSKGFEVMVRCATEPKHLFNADLLHRNLKKMTIAERDSSWSIWCAKEWHSPDDYGSNSPIWVLISWALSADTKQVDNERLYLACLALSWFLTSPKRELRDKATKAIISILGTNINLTRRLLLSFHDVNDPYVLERVLLSAYAVAIETGSSEIAPLVKTTINRFIRSKNHSEHILMRDYISGVLILGEKYKCLPRNITLNDFRYKNSENFPLKIPGVNKVEKLKDKLSSVYSSVMSGDFGTYTMRRIFDFSPTLFSKTKPETGDQTTSKFLDQLYSKNEGFKEIVNNYFSAKNDKSHYDNLKMLLDGERSGRVMFGQSSSKIDLDEQKKNYDPEKHNEITKLYEKSKKQFYSSLNTEDMEEWRWLQGSLGSKRFTKFSRRKAKRWIINKVKEMGWENSLFEDFEKNYCYDRNRTSHEVERIGKKYQWIAYHQFLAILANNYFFFDWKDDYMACEGAWDLSCRNIDPTLLHSGKQSKIYNRDVWWLDSISDISQKMDVEKVEAWIKDRSDLPEDFEGLAKVEPESEDQYFVLNSSQDANSTRHDHYSPYRRISKSISAIIVKNKDINSIVNSLKEKMLYDEFNTRNEYSSGAFIGEYPWHPSWDVNEKS
ncbi:MAG: hypothetical protein KDI92_15995, partial [Xanthomonadales bacterium]|nr:hypothetical protein [Xanthomonadales bacterium]